jgi:hypothetical protein
MASAVVVLAWSESGCVTVAVAKMIGEQCGVRWGERMSNRSNRFRAFDEGSTTKVLDQLAKRMELWSGGDALPEMWPEVEKMKCEGSGWQSCVCRKCGGDK